MNSCLDDRYSDPAFDLPSIQILSLLAVKFDHVPQAREPADGGSAHYYKSGSPLPSTGCLTRASRVDRHRMGETTTRYRHKFALAASVSLPHDRAPKTTDTRPRAGVRPKGGLRPVKEGFATGRGRVSAARGHRRSRSDPLGRPQAAAGVGARGMPRKPHVSGTGRARGHRSWQRRSAKRCLPWERRSELRPRADAACSGSCLRV